MLKKKISKKIKGKISNKPKKININMVGGNKLNDNLKNIHEYLVRDDKEDIICKTMKEFRENVNIKNLTAFLNTDYQKITNINISDQEKIIKYILFYIFFKYDKSYEVFINLINKAIVEDDDNLDTNVNNHYTIFENSVISFINNVLSNNLNINNILTSYLASKYTDGILIFTYNENISNVHFNYLIQKYKIDSNNKLTLEQQFDSSITGVKDLISNIINKKDNLLIIRRSAEGNLDNNKGNFLLLETMIQIISNLGKDVYNMIINNTEVFKEYEVYDSGVNITTIAAEEKEDIKTLTVRNDTGDTVEGETLKVRNDAGKTAKDVDKEEEKEEEDSENLTDSNEAEKTAKENVGGTGDIKFFIKSFVKLKLDSKIDDFILDKLLQSLRRSIIGNINVANPQNFKNLIKDVINNLDQTIDEETKKNILNISIKKYYFEGSKSCSKEYLGNIIHYINIDDDIGKLKNISKNAVIIGNNKDCSNIIDNLIRTGEYLMYGVKLETDALKKIIASISLSKSFKQMSLMKYRDYLGNKLIIINKYKATSPSLLKDIYTYSNLKDCIQYSEKYSIIMNNIIETYKNGF
jgi:hypothetical protein